MNFLLITLGRLRSFGEGVMEWKNMLRVEMGWGFFDRAANRLFGKWNGMECSFGQRREWIYRGVRFGGLANHLTKLTRGRENEIHAEEGRGGMGGGGLVWD